MDKLKLSGNFVDRRTFSELLEDITEVLSNYDCDGLAQIASEVLAKDVEYEVHENNEWFFRVKDKK